MKKVNLTILGALTLLAALPVQADVLTLRKLSGEVYQSKDKGHVEVNAPRTIPRRIAANIGLLTLEDSFDYRGGASPENWKSELEKTDQSLTFDRLSPDGASIHATMMMVNSFFKDVEVMSGGNDRIEFMFDLQLESCDGQAVKGAQPDYSQSVEQIVAGFHRLDLTEFRTCDFNIDKGVFVGKFNANQKYLSNFGVGGWGAPERASLSIVDGNKLILSSGFRGFWGGSNSPVNTTITFEPKEQIKTDFETAAAISTAAQDFIEILNEYGKRIVTTRDDAPAARTQALRAYLESKREDIVKDLKAINDGFAALSFLQKVSIQFNVHAAYDYIHMLELKVARQADPELDLVIKGRASK